jgi:uncharacterized protein (DUF2141 family)
MESQKEGLMSRRGAIISGAAVLLLSGGALAHDAPCGEGSLTVAFQGVTQPRGAVLCAVFDSKAAYDANTGAVRTLNLPAGAGNFSATLAGLPPGHYAVKSFHDRDGDGKMKFNALGMPLEPYGFSNNARAPFGPPSWRAASFEVKPGANAQVIRLR